MACDNDVIARGQRVLASGGGECGLQSAADAIPGHALPSFFVIVKPKRAPTTPAHLAGGRSRISMRNAGVDERRPPRTARNSARTLRVCRIGISASRCGGKLTYRRPQQNVLACI